MLCECTSLIEQCCCTCVNDKPFLRTNPEQEWKQRISDSVCRTWLMFSAVWDGGSCKLDCKMTIFLCFISGKITCSEDNGITGACVETWS